MLRLFLSLFISLFSVGSSLFPLVDNKESINFSDDSKLIKSAFSNENGEGDGYEYCYTQSDLCNIQSLSSILSYCEDFIGSNYSDSTDYYVPIKPLHIGIWTSFDYASGYDWVIDDIFTASFINLYRVTYSDYTFYTFNFLYNTTNYGRFYYFWYYVSNDFDYMLSVHSSWSSTSGLSGDTHMVALFGDTAEFANYQSLYDILGFDRGGAGYEAGFQNGYNTGVSAGETSGYSHGYQDGYSDGYGNATEGDTTGSIIFTGILDVALIPVNVFLTIFNFDVFGVNVSGIVSALLTVSVVVIIFRFVFGGKKDD